MATSTSNTAAAQASIDQQNVYIRDTLMSIASNYANVLKDAVEGAFDSAEASTMAAVGKDLNRTFTRLAKMSDEFAHNQGRINAGILKEKDLTILMYFNRNGGNFNTWGDRINNESRYTYNTYGQGCFGPIFFCKNKVMSNMLIMGADKFLPINKSETGYCEGCYGFFLEDQK